MTEYDPQIVERMVALVRELHEDHVKHGSYDIVQDFVAKTAAIIAELPAPVDPDLLLAREVAAETASIGDWSAQVLAGARDNEKPVRCSLAAIKRVRAETGNG